MNISFVEHLASFSKSETPSNLIHCTGIELTVLAYPCPGGSNSGPIADKAIALQLSYRPPFDVVSTNKLQNVPEENGEF